MLVAKTAILGVRQFPLINAYIAPPPFSLGLRRILQQGTDRTRNCRVSSLGVQGASTMDLM
jgi:hypothetical protein